MRSWKYLMVIMVIFAVMLSACSGDGNQSDQDTAYPAVTDTTGLDNGNLNDNLNGNTNDLNANDVNDNLNANDNAGAPATSTPASMATPLGTAMGTPAATEATGVATETVGPLSTETPAMGTETVPAGTPAAGAGDMQTYENGILLSNLIGATIQNANGDDWGTVDSVILDQATCTAGYLLVDVNDGMLSADATPASDMSTNANGNGNGNANTNGNANANANGNTNANTNVNANDNSAAGADVAAMDGNLVLVPFSAFLDQTAGGLTLPLTIDDAIIASLANAPRYTEDTLPDWTSPDWEMNLNGGATSGATNANDNSAAGTPAATGATMAGTGAVRLTDVTDINVTNSNGDDLGDIEDIALMLNNQPAYAFLAVGGLLDIGERLVPIPCDRITWQVDENGALNVVIDADPDMLENAPSINEIPAAFDLGWDEEYTAYWAGATPGSGSPAATQPVATPTP